MFVLWFFIILQLLVCTLATPKCGTIDQIGLKDNSRVWYKSKITYYIENFSSQMSHHLVEKYVQLAFDTWSPFCNLTFSRTYSFQADVIITFKNGYHGDGTFDDGILAHATPKFVHFNEGQNWVDIYGGETKNGVDFYTVALHEIGHVLGLDHNYLNKDSIMWSYLPFDQVRGLSYEDKVAICKIYLNDCENSITNVVNRVTTVNYYPTKRTTIRSKCYYYHYNGRLYCIPLHSRQFWSRRFGK